MWEMVKLLYNNGCKLLKGMKNKTTIQLIDVIVGYQ
jgi:hypothetical protein